MRLIISGLFHRAIAQSGSCLNSWAFTNSSRRMAFRLGEKLGIKTENPQELLNHLRSVDTKDLTKASHEVLVPEASVCNCHQLPQPTVATFVTLCTLLKELPVSLFYFLHYNMVYYMFSFHLQFCSPYFFFLSQ